jgi:hypothetical protein
MGWFPGLGSQMAAAGPAADAAEGTTGTALSLLRGLNPVWPVLEHPGPHIFTRLALALSARHADFLTAQADAAGATSALAAIPRSTGNATLDTARATLESRLPAIGAASDWLVAAPGILGIGGAPRYLLVLQDPTEIHATGGFIGAVDFVTLRNGVPSHSFTSSIIPVEDTHIPPPAPLGLYANEGFWQFLYSNWSPDFPLAARSERWTYGEGTGQWADGVVNIQDTVMPSLLAATGPVYLPAFNQTVTANNVTALTERYVNGTYHGPSTAGNPDTVRKQFLGALLNALIERSQSLSLNGYVSLGTALAGAVSRRDMLLYDRVPGVEAAIRASNGDGTLRYPGGDFLAVVDDNRSDNKLNPYVREWGEYDVHVGSDLWTDATLTLHYHVGPSPADLEGFGPGGGSRGNKHDYEDFLRVYVPPGTRLISSSGLSRWAPAPAYGMTQLAGDFIVREGATRTIRFHYRVPANAFATWDFRRYVLTIRRQSASNLGSPAVTVRGSGGVRVETAATHISRHVTGDRTLTMPIVGQMSPRTVQLPAPPANLDPYIDLSALRDGKHRF